MPSLLMSPALLTEEPEKSPGLMPLMAKPLVPLRVERLKTEFAIISPVLETRLIASVQVLQGVIRNL